MVEEAGKLAIEAWIEVRKAFRTAAREHPSGRRWGLLLRPARVAACRVACALRDVRRFCRRWGLDYSDLLDTPREDALLALRRLAEIAREARSMPSGDRRADLRTLGNLLFDLRATGDLLWFIGRSMKLASKVLRQQRWGS